MLTNSGSRGWRMSLRRKPLTVSSVFEGWPQPRRDRRGSHDRCEVGDCESPDGRRPERALVRLFARGRGSHPGVVYSVVSGDPMLSRYSSAAGVTVYWTTSPTVDFKIGSTSSGET